MHNCGDEADPPSYVCQEKAHVNSTFLSSEVPGVCCFAGLLTSFNCSPSHQSRQWHLSKLSNPLPKVTAAGLSGTHTRFPFNPKRKKYESEQNRCKDTKKYDYLFFGLNSLIKFQNSGSFLYSSISTSARIVST